MLTVATSSLVLSFRNVVGNDGSDQMSLILFAALSIAALSHDLFIRSAGLVFIAVQSILQIMNTRTYGLEGVARSLARLPGTVNGALCWTIILVETLFFLVLFLPSPWFLVFLMWGLIFHAYNAIVMGLNTFFWSFVATYPCIVFFNHLVSCSACR